LTTIKAKINQHGYSKYVKWKGYDASVSVGFGAVLKMKGTITDTDISINSSGALADQASEECKKLLLRLFPDNSQHHKEDCKHE
jgi:hypothetical protein